MNNENTIFNVAVDNWLQTCNQKLEAYNKAAFPNTPLLQQDKLVADFGPRYVKIRVIGPANNAVWAFIDRTNGDIFKPASFRTPAKGARGNIFDEAKGMSQMGPYGPAYIRGPQIGW